MTRPTPRPHDALFKTVFEVPEHAAGLLRHALPAELLDAIDLASLTHEPGSFVDEALADLHTDLLFTVALRDGTSGYVYVLFEHVSAGVDDLLLRTLAYEVRIWTRFRQDHPRARLPPVLPVIVCHVPRGWTEPRSFHAVMSPDPSSVPGLAAHSRRSVPRWWHAFPTARTP